MEVVENVKFIANITLIYLLISNNNFIGLSEALKWLAENLEEVSLDQEAEGYDPEGEGVPIVPISTDAVEAMQNKQFQTILKGLGIKPPQDEQVNLNEFDTPIESHNFS